MNEMATVSRIIENSHFENHQLQEKVEQSLAQLLTKYVK